MTNPNQIVDHINELITYLVTISLADDQCFAFQRPDRDIVQVTFEGAEHVSIALRDRSYREIYQHLKQDRAYNVKMLDGALIQMMYAFANGTLQRHRLAFFPAPHLEEFQNNPDIYQDDEIHADVIAKNIVPFPVRFDYDAGHYQELVHPKSHLTLGQYEHCRIPVTAPMTPFWFIDFILRNFYHTASVRYTDRLPAQGGSFAESILPAERDVVHMVVPA
ncbi:MAG: DUF2290 domain-containing protein [Gemmatimonadetes bacterium]|nr:DUF2290 domain-containing protein [Gemmatimonadota bacterium]MXY83870.1 DUF2290 domain-containing protein [Gemmatimonadota bacterium]MYB68824.1 DUF2290 domain-containing protein [Gemmatimonadota bacterium]